MTSRLLTGEIFTNELLTSELPLCEILTDELLTSESLARGLLISVCYKKHTSVVTMKSNMEYRFKSDEDKTLLRNSNGS